MSGLLWYVQTQWQSAALIIRRKEADVSGDDLDCLFSSLLVSPSSFLHLLPSFEYRHFRLIKDILLDYLDKKSKSESVRSICFMHTKSVFNHWLVGGFTKTGYFMVTLGTSYLLWPSTVSLAIWLRLLLFIFIQSWLTYRIRFITT